MSGASIETTLELWVSALREVKARMRPLFLQERMARSAGLFLDGLLGPERRKTGWMRAEAAGDPGPAPGSGCAGRALIALPSGVRVYIACGVTDMRKGMVGLAMLVQQGLGADPFDGAVYAFRGRRAGLIKLVWHDGIGLCVVLPPSVVVAIPLVPGPASSV